MAAGLRVRPGEDFDELRRSAERLLRESRPAAGLALSDARALLHELQVHEVELRMQNDALRDAYLEADHARESFRELFEQAPIAYFCLDASGRIEDCNDAAAALLAEDARALRRRRVSAFVAGEHTELFEHHRRQVLASRERCACDVTVIDARGRLRNVRVESALGRRGAWRCAMIDVTELHRLQRRLQDMKKLEAMSTLASGVAHEFNNILMGILGLADMALSQLPEEIVGRAAVEQLQQAAVRGRSLVEQLSTFARRDRHDEVVDVGEVVRSSATMLGRMLGESIALELRLDAREPFIRGDAGELQQILLNLATNARHAMPDGGVLRIETRDVSGDELGADAHAELGFRRVLLLCVSDNGVGMDPEARARAFEPFFTTKPVGFGTGLGLSMVYGAVRRAGGHIELDSHPGRGTTLRVYWPIACGSHGAGPRARGAPIEPRFEHVFVVDDDRFVRLAVRHYLQKAGCAVSEAGSAEEALPLLRAHSRSEKGRRLLLTDVALPGIKGLQLAATARALDPELVVVFSSAHPPEVLADRGWFDPAVPLLRKPFTADELQSAIAAALDALAAA